MAKQGRNEKVQRRQKVRGADGFQVTARRRGAKVGESQL